MRLIDADEPLKALKTMTKSLANHQRSDFLEGFYNGCLAATFDIEETPTVDAVGVKHGRWESEEGYYGDEFATCSECKEIFDIGEASLPLFAEFYKYCPSCGAKMDLKENEIE